MEDKNQNLAIISDIHGCYESLRALASKIPDSHEIIFCGDLIDRGPNSAAVIRHAMEYNIKTVMGNHEHLMLHYYGHNREYDHPDIWMMNGGLNTIHSFNSAVPKNVIDWVKNLPLFLKYDGLLISHTGHGLGKNQFNALWQRDRYFPNDGLFRVFGHTQAPEPEVTKTYAMIDTGCAYKSRGLGKLTAFLWPERTFLQVHNREKTIKSDEIL